MKSSSPGARRRRIGRGDRLPRAWSSPSRSCSRSAICVATSCSRRPRPRRRAPRSTSVAPWPCSLQGQRFDTALNNMLQGLLMFDHDRRDCWWSTAACIGMFGMPDGVLMPGMTYREVTDRVIEAGQVTADDMRDVRERRAGLLARNERASTIWELASGRVFNVTHQPMDDGWLATFEDISERRRTEARMAHLAHHDALTDLPNRVLFRNETGGRAALPRGAVKALRCYASTSTSSRRSTTRSVIRSATRCCRRWQSGWWSARARRTPWRGLAATNLPSSRLDRQAVRSGRARRPVDRDVRHAVRGGRPSDRHRHQHRHRLRARRTASMPTNC